MLEDFKVVGAGACLGVVFTVLLPLLLPRRLADYGFGRPGDDEAVIFKNACLSPFRFW